MLPADAKPPLPGANLIGWGYLQLNQEFCPHIGTDFNINHGSPSDDYRAPVVAAFDGRVVAAIPKLLYSWGRLVVVRHILPYAVMSSGRPVVAGSVLYAIYGHLDSFDVWVGQEVKVGQQVGRVGGSNGAMPGNWKGDKSDPNGGWNPHLHYGLRDGGLTGLPDWDAGNEWAVQEWPTALRYGYPPVGSLEMLPFCARRFVDPFAAIPASRVADPYRSPTVF
jgi:murein DD-endopeptidase MepM/ murein hydrolase activator NlpD